METYDLYINAKKPGIGLYVRHGAPLPGFAHPDDRRFDREDYRRACELHG